MRRTGTFEVVKDFTFDHLPEHTPGGGLYFGLGRKMKPGDRIEITKVYVEGFGSDAVPEQEARLADGTVGRIGQGVTVNSGYLRPIDSEEDWPMETTNRREFSGDERGGWYRFMFARCQERGVEHNTQAEHEACEREAMAAWDALTEDEREQYRAEFRALNKEG